MRFALLFAFFGGDQERCFTFTHMRTLPVAVAVLTSVAALTSCSSQDTALKPAPTVTVTVTASPSVTIESTESAAATTDAATSTALVMRPRDWQIAVKIRKQDCFGSAGCNITFQIDPTYVGAAPLNQAYDITYEVLGGDSGPQVNTFSVDDTGQASFDQEEDISTGPNPHLTAKVTAIQLSN